MRSGRSLGWDGEDWDESGDDGVMGGSLGIDDDGGSVVMWDRSRCVGDRDVRLIAVGGLVAAWGRS